MFKYIFLYLRGLTDKLNKTSVSVIDFGRFCSEYHDKKTNRLWVIGNYLGISTETYK